MGQYWVICLVSCFATLCASAPCPSLCICDAGFFACDGPLTIASIANGSSPHDVTDLQIANASLTTLDGLSAFTSIVRLAILSNNQPPFSKPEPFSSVGDTLRSLTITDSHITSLNALVFSGLGGLEQLFLNSNMISSLQGGVFSHLTSLSELVLDGNSLTMISEGVFGGLGSLLFLGVGENELTSFDDAALTSLSKLETFDVHSNKLTVLPSLKKNTALTEVLAQHNAITRVDAGVISGLPRLKTLALDNNRISSLAADVFQGLSSLITLTLFQNMLTSLNPGIFNSTRSIRGLFLSNNNLTSIDGLFLNLPDLVDLTLFSNQITEVNDHTFGGHFKLKHLSLFDNQIRSIDQIAFVNLRASSLQYLLLNNNSLNRPGDLQEALNNVPGFPGDTFLYSSSFNPVSCFFASTEVQFHCSCNQLFVLRNGVCYPPPAPNTTPKVLGSVFGGLFGGAFVTLFVLYFLRRNRKLKFELGLREHLLETQAEELQGHIHEVLELKRAWDIDPTDIDIIRRIDEDCEGAFGEVFYAEWDGLGVAMKRLRRGLVGLDTSMSHEFELEVDFLRKCRHRNIVRFFGAGTWQGVPFLVLEYMQGGALSTLLASTELSIDVKLSLALDVQAGMQFIHGLNRLHRDLKPQNVLLSGESPPRAKVSDFGSMKSLLTGKGADHQIEFDEDLNLTYGVGTPLYMAPEMIRRGDMYGPSADVWSYGTVLWEIFTQQVPNLPEAHPQFSWSGPFLCRLEAAYNEGLRLPLDGVQGEVATLIRSCWTNDAHKRCSLKTIGWTLAKLQKAQ